MADWEDDDWDSGAPAKSVLPPTVAPVLDSWEDEDASEEEEAPEKKAPEPAPMRPAKARALALKERERKENERLREKALAREKELDELSAAERKMRMQKIVEEADLDNARDLFVGSAADADGFIDEAPTLENFTPKTEEEFKKYADMLGTKCRSFNTNPKRTLRYVTFVKDVIRELSKELGADDAKDLSTFVGLLSNEKREAFKKSKGHKKKSASKKAHVKVDKASDIRDDDYDDFDGFM